MVFKNLQIYRLASLPGDLEEQLARGPFTPCANSQFRSKGWVPPRGPGALAHAFGQGEFLIALMVEERLLPRDVVTKEVNLRASAIEQEQGYAPGRKARREIEELVIAEFLPRAFTRQRLTRAWIDTQGGWLVIDASTQGRADEVIDHLRHCLDEFQLTRLHTRLSPTAAMADWLASEEPPFGFTIDRDCALKANSEDKATVAYSHCPLEGDDIKAHLAGGKLPTKLAITWNDRLSFVLTGSLEVKRLTFLDVESNGEEMDGDLAILSGELRAFLPQLVDALGGEVSNEGT